MCLEEKNMVSANAGAFYFMKTVIFRAIEHVRLHLHSGRHLPQGDPARGIG
jgi:hypothetical protein